MRFEIPSTKQIESKMFDLPEPFNPVIALNNGSNPGTTVRLAYDLKPSMHTSSMYIARAACGSRAPTNAAMKRSVDAHWKLLMDAATPEPLEPENLTEEELAAFAEKAKEYSRKTMAQHREWQRDINQKIRLKRAALAALPEGFLRDEATKEDLALFPLKRQTPMVTPPIEGFYEEKQRRAEEAVSGASGRDGPSR